MLRGAASMAACADHDAGVGVCSIAGAGAGSIVGAGSSVAVATRVAWWWKCLVVLIGFGATLFASSLACGEVLASLVAVSLECINIFNSEPGCPAVSLSCAAAALTAKANTAPAVTMRMLSMSVLHRKSPRGHTAQAA
jgi:hypothetical protein